MNGGLQAGRTALAPLIELGANVKLSDVYSAISGARAAGLPTDEIVNLAANKMPAMDPAQIDNSQAVQAYRANLA